MLQPGTVIGGRYSLVRVLASGGYARVYHATDLKLARDVAVKVSAPSLASVAESQNRLEREGRLAGSVSHPNVCALTDVGELPNGAPFLVFELLFGETAIERLARGVLPVEQVVRIGEQVLAGLGAMHEQGIVHRDIKPANVFLIDIAPGFTLVKLLDFGAAQRPDDPQVDGAQLTSTGFVVGTAEYMSPEQVRGVREFDARTDIYSTGVLMFELLTGQRPFPKKSLAELLQAIGYERAPSIAQLAPRVPRNVARAIDIALATDRDHRHPDVAAFASALRAPVQAPQMTAPTRIVGSATTAPADESGDWDMATRESGPPDSVLAEQLRRSGIEPLPATGPDGTRPDKRRR